VTTGCTARAVEADGRLTVWRLMPAVSQQPRMGSKTKRGAMSQGIQGEGQTAAEDLLEITKDSGSDRLTRFGMPGTLNCYRG